MKKIMKRTISSIAPVSKTDEVPQELNQGFRTQDSDRRYALDLQRKW